MRTFLSWALTWTLALGACSTENGPLAPPQPERLPASAAIAFVSDREGTQAVYLANADGSGVKRIASGTSPAWSPDGRRLAFAATGDYADYGIVVVEEDGSRQYLVPGGYPAWSPDGRHIVYSVGAGVNGGIFLMNANGTGAQRIVSSDIALPDEWLGLPDWSPNGETIAFVRATYDEGWSIFFVNADGSGLRQPPLAGDEAVWSPDGSRLAMRMNAGRWGIWTARPDGRDAVTYVPGYAISPAWGPEDGSLLFASYAGPPLPRSPLGSRLRIFMASGPGAAALQLIPDAVNPVRADYRDDEPAWRPGR